MPEIVSMVNVTYSPIKEIIIHEIRDFPPQQFFETLVMGIQTQAQGITPSVSWLDGITFAIGNYAAASERIVNEQLDGKVHYAFVHFTRTSYEAEKRPTVSGRQVVVRMIKLENNPPLEDVVKFLQNFKPDNPVS